jgi:hypothetical protein
MKKTMWVPALLFVTACSHQASRPELTQEDKAWIVQECQARFPEPDKNSWCLMKLTEALTNAYAGQQRPHWESTTRTGTASEPYVGGTPVYRMDECTGPVINGECHGAIIPKSAVPQRCYGTMLNGQCTGPQF